MRKKMNKAKIVVLLLVAFLIFCNITSISFAMIEKETATASQMELVQNDVNVRDLDINPINTKEVSKTVVPNPVSEGKKVFGLFIKTMCLTILSLGLIYGALLLFKKFNGVSYTQQKDEFEQLDLSSPNNKQDALKIFLNRTK